MLFALFTFRMCASFWGLMLDEYNVAVNVPTAYGTVGHFYV